ncbi:MAG: hypothetical protein HYW47_06650 [Deltaproteobacteria bacterium]|nr:hypothetical protein [Deltaproteobacteria bacterium]
MLFTCAHGTEIKIFLLEKGDFLIIKIRLLVLTLLALVSFIGVVSAKEVHVGFHLMIEDEKLFDQAKKTIHEMLETLTREGFDVVRVNLKSNPENPITIPEKYITSKSYDMERYMNDTENMPVSFATPIFPLYEKLPKNESDGLIDYKCLPAKIGFFMDANKAHVLYAYFLHVVEAYDTEDKTAIYPNTYLTNRMLYNQYVEAKKKYECILQKDKKVAQTQMEEAELIYLEGLLSHLKYTFHKLHEGLAASRYLYDHAQKLALNKNEKKSLLAIFNKNYNAISEAISNFENQFNIEQEKSQNYSEKLVKEKAKIYKRYTDIFDYNPYLEKDLIDFNRWFEKRVTKDFPGMLNK